MADLVTHVASALLWKSLSGGRRTALLVVGVVLPDLAGRVPTMLATRLDGALGLRLPDALISGWGVLHMPLGFMAMCLLLSLVVVRADRVAVFKGLLAGCALHLALDLLQHHVGVGYPLVFPFSSWHFELGWIGSEATVPWALPSLAVSALMWAARQRLAPRPPRSGGDPHGPVPDHGGQ